MQAWRWFFKDETKVSGMPGKRITDNTVNMYKQYRDTLNHSNSAVDVRCSCRSNVACKL